MDIPIDIIAIVVSFILGYAINHYGKEYTIVKEKFKKVSDLISILDKSLEDDKVTSEEMEKIIEAIERLCK